VANTNIDTPTLTPYNYGYITPIWARNRLEYALWSKLKHHAAQSDYWDA
jgi:hypothetical protein